MFDTHQMITKIHPYYLSLFLRTPQPNPFKFKFFRARKLKDLTNPQLRCEYSYPPSKSVTQNLRANLIGNPVFYSSEHPLIALLELIQQWDDPSHFKEDIYVISCWVLRKEGQYLIAPFIPKSVEHKNEFSVLGQFTNEEFRNKLDININDEQIEGVRVLKEFFGNLYIDPDNRSTISSYLAHYYLYENPIEPPIFIYPSLKARHSMVNFALHPNFVDERMQLSHIYKVKVQSIDEQIEGGMNFRFQILDDFGVYNSEKITWCSIKENKSVFDKLYESDWKANIKR